MTHLQVGIYKICKQYISEVKTFFPIIGKDERDYISKLKTNVDDFCDEANISTKEELYKQYGMPIDVVHDYYSSADAESIIKRIRLTKYITRAIIVLLFLALVSTSFYCVNLYSEHQEAFNENIIFSDDEIVIY